MASHSADPKGPAARTFQGRVTRLQGNAEERMKIPHVGWNALDFKGAGRILEGLEPRAHVYFTHSYAAPVTGDCVAVTTHSETFAAVVERGNVFGVQFHPEKSSDAGLQIIRNFLEVARGSSDVAPRAEAEC